MEQKIVPTSPRSEYKKTTAAEPQAHRARATFIGAIISIALGAGAGFLGFVIAATIPADWPIIGTVNVVELLRREQDQVLLTSLRGGTSVAEQAPEVFQQVVSLYASVPTQETAATFVGNALTLTADGWMVTPASVYVQHDTALTAPVVVLSNGEMAAVTKTVVDDLTGLTFFQVDELSLPFVQFTSDQSLRVGQNVAVVEKDLGGVSVAEDRVVGDANHSVGPRTTTTIQSNMQVNNTHRAGSPVFTSNGQAVGIMRSDTSIVHASLIQSALQSIGTTGAIQHSTRAITSINLAAVIDEEKVRQGLPDAGIDIIAIDRVQDLEAGDVILNINNAAVDERTDLATVFHSKPAGTLWRMTVLRGGSEVTIDVRS